MFLGVPLDCIYQQHNNIFQNVGENLTIYNNSTGTAKVDCMDNIGFYHIVNYIADGQFYRKRYINMNVDIGNISIVLLNGNLYALHRNNVAFKVEKQRICGGSPSFKYVVDIFGVDNDCILFTCYDLTFKYNFIDRRIIQLGVVGSNSVNRICYDKMCTSKQEFYRSIIF